MIFRKPLQIFLLVILIGTLILSLGYNYHLVQCLNKLENTIHCSLFMSPLEYQKITEELNRLENTKYK